MTKKTPASKAQKTRRTSGKPSRALPASEVRKELTIVGIGASAGGLQALQAFFDHLKAETGMAFVVVTHMHPEHESHLADLLQPHTTMQVEQVNKITPVRADHVYVMPPNHQVLISDSHLDLGDFEEPRGRRTPIDGFFRSLAAAHQDAVGIILSGSGTDGSVGIKDIKENGGLLLVQNPDEAEYDGMPRAAISTGLADLVLPVAQLAEKLVDYSREWPALPHDPEHLTGDQQVIVDLILAKVHARTGNDFVHYKRSTILRRIQRRMQLNGYTTLDAYLGYLRQQNGEASAMFNDILIGVTNFFRDRPSWDALGKTVIPSLFEHKDADTPVRVWSIGCATGEEAYALAMLLCEHAATLHRHHNIQVFASDLADASLARAREGQYPTAIEADVSPERLDRFFSQEGNHYRVKRELRDLVLFTNHNILRDPPFSHIDLIVCRNLLIYLRREVQENIFEIFHYALNPGGFLFLGNSESADSAPALFQMTDKIHRIYHAKPWTGSQHRLPLLPLSGPSLGWQQPRRPDIKPEFKKPMEAPNPLHEHETALEIHGPPSIIIDEHYNIVHVSETAGRFLVQRKGAPTREFLNLVRPELQPELQTALFQAFERNQKVMTNPVWVRFDGYVHRVVVSVNPFGAADQQPEKQALVLFLEDEINQSVNHGEASPAAEDARVDTTITRLEAEIRQLREQLQGMLLEYNISNEGMRASNEELQSINEEYRSTTEELETSREELQSVNEELQTVNNELKSKLDEISRTNSDLENLMAASEIATLFLDRDLHIKRYTAGMDQVTNLLPADHGRPIAHFANKLGYDQLVEDSENVLHRLATFERELQNSQGRWYLVRLRPYRTVDQKIDGVVITFVDVTELKQAQRALQQLNETLQVRVAERTSELDQANRDLIVANKMFTTMFQSNPIPTALNRLQDWVFINVNQAYLDYFNVPHDGVVGRPATEIGFAPDADMRARMRRVLEETGSLQHIELTFPVSGEKRTALGSLQKIDMEGEPRVISSFIDITERVKAEQQIRSLASELTLAEQRERHRISQVLHNELQQRLFAIRMQLTFLREAYQNQELDTFKVDLPQIESEIAEAIEVTRSLSIDLSPVILKGEGLSEAILWLGSQMEDKFGLRTSVEAHDGGCVLDESLRILLYQSVRELLFNVVKHSGTLEAKVDLRQVDSRLRIAVIDKGVGFNTKTLKPHIVSSHGLLNALNKLTLMGCSMQINSAPSAGTEVIIEVPISQDED